MIIEPGLIDTGFANGVQDQFVVTDGSAYADLANALNETYETGKSPMSSPSVITDLVMRAIRAPKPKTRYTGGALARPSIFLRWLLPDRWFDRMIMSQIK